MIYIYNYPLGSLPFFALTLFFYFRRKRMNRFADKLYSIGLWACFAALALDVAASVIQQHSQGVPYLVVYLVNALFLIAFQLCLPVFMLYCIAVAGRMRVFTKRRRVLVMLPFLCVSALILLSPLLPHGIFYIDEQRLYRSGSLHILLYADTLFYIAASIIMLLKNYSKMSRGLSFEMIVFGSIVIGSAVLQQLFPRYLLTTSAAALGFTFVYYSMEYPVEKVVPYMGAFSRMQLAPLIQDYGERGINCTMLLYSLNSFEDIVQVYGITLSDKLQAEFAKWLQKQYEKDIIVYMDTSDFVVVTRKNITPDRLLQLNSLTPTAFCVDNYSVAVSARLAAVPVSAQNDANIAFTAVDYIFQQSADAAIADAFYADEAFQRECSRELSLESKLRAVFSEGTPTIHFAPLYTVEGDIAGEEAFLTAEHCDTGSIPAKRLINLVKQQEDVAYQYGELLSRLAGARSERFNSKRRLHLPLFSVACLQANSADRICGSISAAGLQPSQIMFSLSEADVLNALPVVRENIVRLTEFGCELCIDNFADGYTDVELFMALPCNTIKLGPAFVHSARADRRRKELLKSIVKILNDLDKRVVLTGVDTQQDYRSVLYAGGELIQGDYAVQLAEGV